MLSRRDFIKIGAVGAGIGAVGIIGYVVGKKFTPVKVGLKPLDLLGAKEIKKYQTALLIPPVMPRAGIILDGNEEIDYYEISMRQFEQQILPEGLPKTTVWGYGAISAESKDGLLLHNAPSLTIEAISNRPVRVKWINDLMDDEGNYLPHLLPVDPTLHWANPEGGEEFSDLRPKFEKTPDRKSVV